MTDNTQNNSSINIEQAAALREQIDSLETQLARLAQEKAALVAQLRATTPPNSAASNASKTSVSRQPDESSAYPDRTTEDFVLRILADCLPDFIYAKDADHRYIFNNARSIETMGAANQAELLGKTDFDYLPPEFAQRYYVDEEIVLTSGQPIINQEERYIDAAGTQGWVLTTKVPVKNEQEEVVGLVGLSRDITRQKEEQAAIALSRDFLHRLIQQLPIGVQIFDTNGLCIGANDSLRQIFGFAHESDVVGKFNLFEDDLAAQVGTQAAGRAALQGDVVHLPEVYFDFEKADPRFTASEGQRFISVTFFPVKTAEGTVVQIVALNEDITDQKKTEQAIKQVQTNYQALVEQLPAITYVVQYQPAGNRTIYISPQVEEILGFTPDEWLANPDLWRRQIHPDDRQEVLQTVINNDIGHKNLDIEYRALTKDNRVVWVRNKNTLQTDNNQPRFAHGIIFDINQQKKIEEQLRYVQRMEAVGQMAGGIAHNFNNVFTSLIGHTELAIDTLPEDHPVRQDLDSIRKSARRAANLTQQLLAFTRHHVTKPEVVNLSELLLETEFMLNQLVDDRVKMAIEPYSNLWAVKIDPAQIEQVLVNLVVNARDAMPHGGTLKIATANLTIANNPNNDPLNQPPPGDYVLLTVSDTGTGIPPEIQPHIFEPFFTTKEVGHGTGLGLSTCFGIIQQSKGYLLVESKANQGAVFKIYLPRTQASSPAARPASKGWNATVKKNAGTILLVDDALLVRQMSARVLRQQGFTVLEAASGQEALTVLQQQNPEELTALITDLSMPHMSGDTLARHVLNQHPHTKVLLISGHSDQTLTSRGIFDSGFAVLTKPFAPNMLLEKLDALLNPPAAN